MDLCGTGYCLAFGTNCRISLVTKPDGHDIATMTPILVAYGLNRSKAALTF